MRSLMRVLMCAAVAALVLAAGSVLIKGPETTEEKLPACAPAPMLVRAAAPADEVVPVLRSERHEEHAAASRTDDTVCIMVSAPETDGNGWPVTARTWLRAMYTACPPEGLFG